MSDTQKDAANKLLLEAVRDGNLENVQSALQQGADVNAETEWKDSALNVAARNGHLEIVQCLVEKGANLEHKDSVDKTPLMNAAMSDHTEGHNRTVLYLIEKGADVTKELLMSIGIKISVLEENVERGMVLPEGVEWYKNFFEILQAARTKQDLPELIKYLHDEDTEVRLKTVWNIGIAAMHGMDISLAVPELKKVLKRKDENKDVTGIIEQMLQLLEDRKKNSQA